KHYIHHQKDAMLANYQAEESQIKQDAKPLNLQFNEKEQHELHQNIQKHSMDTHFSLQEDKQEISGKKSDFEHQTQENIEFGKENAERWVVNRRKKDFFKEEQ
ncbi:MAG: hypothetical protein QG556_275, partial [Pseudomonadota bacterium]|nr:hypothetical protein [Pseudomonadota bacterium]